LLVDLRESKLLPVPATTVRTTFRAVIEKDGVNLFVNVPAGVSRAFAVFAEKGRIRVAGIINGHPLHATLLPTKTGTQRLYINGGMRAAAVVSVGDRVTLELRALQFDEVDLPEDLAHALTKASLRPRFDALSASHRRELLRTIEDARSETNRAARIERTSCHLRGGSTQQAESAIVDKPLWVCPKCGHPSVTKNMNHSCARHEFDEVFQGKPRHIRQLFDRFRALVDARGPTTMVVYRDRVAFMVKARFEGATPKRNHLELGFWFTERDEPRVSRRSRRLRRTRMCIAPRSAPCTSSMTTYGGGSIVRIASAAASICDSPGLRP
jgi:hypothetical protein